MAHLKPCKWFMTVTCMGFCEGWYLKPKGQAGSLKSLEEEKGIYLLNFNKLIRQDLLDHKLLEIWELVVCQKSKQEFQQSQLTSLPIFEHSSFFFLMQLGTLFMKITSCKFCSHYFLSSCKIFFMQNFYLQLRFSGLCILNNITYNQLERCKISECSILF